MNTFAYVVGTRGHPLRAEATVQAAMHLALAPERVIPVVSIDDDDGASVNHKWGTDRLTVVIGPRPSGLGDVWNRGAECVDAEFYIHAADDGFMATPGWDVLLDKVLTEFQMRELAVVGINNQTNPGILTHPVVSREWIKMVGYWFDRRFPFWFIDSALGELAAFLIGGPIKIITNVNMAVKNAPTVRMRDLKLWGEFFMATRIERVQQAERLRNTLGFSVDPTTIEAMIARGNEASMRMIAKADATEKKLADQSTVMPDGYEALKQSAVDYMSVTEKWSPWVRGVMAEYMGVPIQSL